MQARDIMPMVYTPIGDVLARAAAGSGKPLTVHVKIDTGLGRVGVPYREAAAFVRDLASRKGVVIGGMMMTFTEDLKFDQEQLRRFEALTSELSRAGVKHRPPSRSVDLHAVSTRQRRPRHGAAGNGALRDLPGAGVSQGEEVDLRPALAFRTRVVYVKKLEAGESAGYERAYVAKARHVDRHAARGPRRWLAACRPPRAPRSGSAPRCTR